MKRVKAFAPASIGNLAVGFDILGLALSELGDTVELVGEKLGQPLDSTRAEVNELLTIESIQGIDETLPKELKKNTASQAILSFLGENPLPYRFSLRIKKGIPLSSGLGGSAASAVAGVLAVNEFLPRPLSKKGLLKYAIQGEAVASGSVHADNVAPCLLGGLQLVVGEAETISLPWPQAVCSVVVCPSLKIDTKKARGLLRETLPLKAHVEQSASLAGFIAGCFTSDLNLIQSSLKDVLIEPQRKSMIAGFEEAKRSALEAGALGFSISGAGPSVFALTAGREVAERVSFAIEQTFDQHNLSSKKWISENNSEGALVVSS